MDTQLREIVHIIDNGKAFIMFVFTSGVRELYDITGNENIGNFEDVKKVGKFVARDYNGNNPNPSPIPTIRNVGVCQACGVNMEEMEKMRSNLEVKEREIEQREKELDKELEKLSKNRI